METTQETNLLKETELFVILRGSFRVGDSFLFSLSAERINNLHQLVNKEPHSKYFRLCGLYRVSISYFSLFLFLLFYTLFEVKAVLTLGTVQKQSRGWICTVRSAATTTCGYLNQSEFSEMKYLLPQLYFRCSMATCNQCLPVWAVQLQNIRAIATRSSFRQCSPRQEIILDWASQTVLWYDIERTCSYSSTLFPEFL